MITTSSSTLSPTISATSNYTDCIYGWYLFKGGLNQTQAQAEGTGTAYKGVSGYWYYSGRLNSSMCIKSCLKYGFVYAAIEPKYKYFKFYILVIDNFIF
jgi:hypothetical protein